MQMMTNKLNIFFKILFILVIGITIIIGVNFFYHLNKFYKLSQNVPAHIEKWDIDEIKGGKYLIGANYNFTFQGVNYKGYYQFSRLSYQNIYLAKDHLEKLKKKTWDVYFEKNNPNISTLQHLFPFKQGVHLALSLGILFYFFCLHLYIKRNSFV